MSPTQGIPHTPSNSTGSAESLDSCRPSQSASSKQSVTAQEGRVRALSSSLPAQTCVYDKNQKARPSSGAEQIATSNASLAGSKNKKSSSAQAQKLQPETCPHKIAHESEHGMPTLEGADQLKSVPKRGTVSANRCEQAPSMSSAADKNKPNSAGISVLAPHPSKEESASNVS